MLGSVLFNLDIFYLFLVEFQNTEYGNYHHGKDQRDTVKKSSKNGKDKKTLISVLRHILLLLANSYTWKGDWALSSFPNQLRNFPDIF